MLMHWHIYQKDLQATWPLFAINSDVTLLTATLVGEEITGIWLKLRASIDQSTKLHCDECFPHAPFLAETACIWKKNSIVVAEKNSEVMRPKWNKSL